MSGFRFLAGSRRAFLAGAGDPVVVGGLAAARKFERGGPGYCQAVSAAELKQKLGLSS